MAAQDAATVLPDPDAAEFVAGPARVSLHSKIAEVQSEIGVMPKDRHVDVEKNGQRLYSYDYLSESALMIAVRQALASRSVAVYVSVTDQRREGQLTMVGVSLTFADGESGETFTITGQGSGADTGDKGVYKAITGAVRYMLWKTFLVPTEGDDPNQPHQVVAERTDAPGTIKDVVARINGFVADAAPWIKEAILAGYPEIAEFPSSFSQLPQGVKVNAFMRLQKVVVEMEEEPNFDPQADPAQTQALVRRAFSKAFDGKTIAGPDPFEPPIPF